MRNGPARRAAFADTERQSFISAMVKTARFPEGRSRRRAYKVYALLKGKRPMNWNTALSEVFERVDAK